MTLWQHLPPGTIMMLGALFIPLLPRTVQGWSAILLPVLSMMHLLMSFSDGFVLDMSFMGNQLTPIRVDRLSLIFGYIFHIAAFMSAIYAARVNDPIQHLSSQVYAGAAIAAAFCGDLISLFVFWELTAISSVFLIWASRTEDSLHCGVRYLILQVASGVILLAGALMLFHNKGTLAFVNFAEDGLDTAETVILWAFAIKAAFPFLHNWLQDAYPKATYSGTVFLSAFTTKLAIYALARGFAGTSFLIPIGCVMTIFPIFFAVIENDLRKVLAYSLNNQLGFMVVGIGIGTPLAIDGACAHAFAHIIYKGLLFMSMGAVLMRVGTTEASELGGLHKKMPYTTVFCIIGAASISAFPLLSGFAAKSLIASAAAYSGLTAVTFVLLFASAGVMEHSGIKIPFFAFFAHDAGHDVEEAPNNMLVAMGIAAALCIGIGVYPSALYNLLPNGAIDAHHDNHMYNAYTFGHILTQFELLVFAALAFAILMRSKIYPAEIRAVNLDFDWVYRRLLPRFINGTMSLMSAVAAPIGKVFAEHTQEVREEVMEYFSDMRHQKSVESGYAAIWAALLLACFMILYMS